jgi:hypothetical protein
VSYRRERLPSNVFKMAYAINRNFHFDFTIMTLNIQYTGCIKKNATSEFPKKSLCNS